MDKFCLNYSLLILPLLITLSACTPMEAEKIGGVVGPSFGSTSTAETFLKQEFVSPNRFEISTTSDAVTEMKLYLDMNSTPYAHRMAAPFSAVLDTAGLSDGVHAIRAEISVELFGVLSHVERVLVFSVSNGSDSMTTPQPTIEPSGEWSVVFQPPALSQPRIIRIPADVPLSDLSAYNGHCAGKIYQVDLANNEDAIITQSGTAPLDKPVWINGGRNVRVIGLEMALQVQPGCDNGGYLKVPGGIALRVEQAGTTFIEGLKMDLNGHSTDCIVARNAGLSEAQALANRNVYVQNSACRGARPGGDYLHADFFQNQGAPNDPINRVVFENISHMTTASGVVLDGKINEAIALNYEFALDKRYGSNQFVLNPLWMKAQKIVFKNIWTDFDLNNPITGNMPGTVRDDSAGIYFSFVASGVIQRSPEVKKGVPPTQFAAWEKIGLRYHSPHP